MKCNSGSCGIQMLKSFSVEASGQSEDPSGCGIALGNSSRTQERLENTKMYQPATRHMRHLWFERAQSPAVHLGAL